MSDDKEFDGSQPWVLILIVGKSIVFMYKSYEYFVNKL